MSVLKCVFFCNYIKKLNLSLQIGSKFSEILSDLPAWVILSHVCLTDSKP